MSQSTQNPAAPMPAICPRCGVAMAEVHYGPCRVCRADLRAKVSGRTDADVVIEAAERIHRTPNFVATKD